MMQPGQVDSICQFLYTPGSCSVMEATNYFYPQNCETISSGIVWSAECPLCQLFTQPLQIRCPPKSIHLNSKAVIAAFVKFYLFSAAPLIRLSRLQRTVIWFVGKLLFAHRHLSDLETSRDQLLLELHKQEKHGDVNENDAKVSYLLMFCCSTRNYHHN